MMRRLVPPILFLACLGLMLLLKRLWPLATVFLYPWNLLGLLPLGLGCTLGCLGVREFRRARTTLRPFHEAASLVTTGPFRYTRNPMYLGIASVLLGSWLLLGALTPLLGVLLFVTVADRWYIPFEEKTLHRKFGPTFEAYCAATRRWF